MQKTENKQTLVDEMFEVGAQYGYSKTRRHPSVSPYIYGTKNKNDIIDLEKTEIMLKEAEAFLKELGSKGKIVLIVGTKPETKAITQKMAESIDMPYVNERWIGGIMTNFVEIKKRITELEEHHKESKTGGLEKYTKKERLVIGKKMERLERYYSGILGLKKMPDAVFIIDPRNEKTALKEAISTGVPIISLLNTDCNMKDIKYPILANDSAIPSVSFFTKFLADAYKSNILTKK